MSGAIIAAAAIKRQRDEEEQRTNYSRQDMESDYEFKILRSLTGAFRKPLVMEKALAEEAVSGWKLVEKFDDSRMRLYRKRHPNQSATDGMDPYRTQYGMRPSTFVTLAFLGSIIFTFSIIVLAGGTVSKKLERRLMINGVDYGEVSSSDQVDPFASPPRVNGVPRQPIVSQAKQSAGDRP